MKLHSEEHAKNQGSCQKQENDSAHLENSKFTSLHTLFYVQASDKWLSSLLSFSLYFHTEVEKVPNSQ